MTETIKSRFRPLVTVIVTTYDRPEQVKRALKSVQEQTYNSLEVIVVEDGTDTGIESWVEEVMPTVGYICHDENQGLAAARNTGLEHASGEYVAYLDDDDEWKPERVERQVAEIGAVSERDRTNIGVVYCAVERRTPDGDIRSVGHPRNHGDLRQSIKEEGALTRPSTFLFRTKALLEVGGFDESLLSSIDHDIWMSLAEGDYHSIALDEPLVITYVSPAESMVTNTDSRIEGVKQFVEKWTPTYREWFGPDRGTQYGQRYFARVIARLVADKCVTGEFSDAWRGTREIFQYSSQYSYNVRILVNTISKKVAVRTLPSPLVDYLRKFT